jgi:Rod binding domain-containing protein
MPTPPIAGVEHVAQVAEQDHSQAIRGAAQQFEALLLTQLMSTMRRTIPQGMMGSGYDSQVFTSMFDQAMSDQMSRGGGVGLADIIARQLDPHGITATEESSAREPLDLRAAMRVGAARRAYSTTGDLAPSQRAIGAIARVHEVGAEMVDPARAHVWGRSGRLEPQDLTNDYMTEGENGVEGFNVLDANGFYDNYKCNLFAFEMAYRSGLRVPIMGRGRGWGYFGPHGVIRQIQSGRIDGSWSVRADHLTVEDFDRAREQGVPFMLVGEGRDGRAGHMGIVDVIHRIDRAPSGEIHRIEYSGWEANGDGAHYRRRTWGLGRFASIHALELREPAEGEAQCFVVGRGPQMPSRHDAERFEARRRGEAASVAGARGAVASSTEIADSSLRSSPEDRSRPAGAER